MKLLPPLAALAALAACATVPPAADPALDDARFGETVTAGGPKVTPLTLVEDSRCPQGVQCVWAGRVRITATISTPTSKLTKELTLGQPAAVPGGTLTLADVRPPRRADAAIAMADYRLGIRFES